MLSRASIIEPSTGRLCDCLCVGVSVIGTTPCVGLITHKVTARTEWQRTESLMSEPGKESPKLWSGIALGPALESGLAAFPRLEREHYLTASPCLGAPEV
jgi:hypothetical protein